MNLTGGDIQTILDNLLYRALEPVVLNTTIFDTQIVHVLSRITINKKRKLVSIDRIEAMSMLCKALVETDPTVKFALIEKVKIERSIIHRFLTNVLLDLNNYYSLYLINRKKASENCRKKMDVIANTFGTNNPDSLFFVKAQVSEFLESYFQYRNSVVDHYIKFSYKMSSNFRTSKLNNFDSHDVTQNFLSAVTKAIDKYDSDKGALTSYINYWILNAQTCNSNSSEYGIAYTLPHGRKRNYVTDKTNVNFSMSLDSEEIMEIEHSHNVQNELETDEENNIVRYLIKAVDKKGCLRLTSDIDEFFSKKEYEKMRDIVLKQKNG